MGTETATNRVIEVMVDQKLLQCVGINAAGEEIFGITRRVFAWYGAVQRKLSRLGFTMDECGADMSQLSQEEFDHRYPGIAEIYASWGLPHPTTKV
jgi:hypothetical protein